MTLSIRRAVKSENVRCKVAKGAFCMVRRSRWATEEEVQPLSKGLASRLLVGLHFSNGLSVGVIRRLRSGCMVGLMAWSVPF